MASNDPRAAWEYHDATKHTFASVRSSGHVLDWSIQPLPYKIYPELEAIPLPRELPVSSVPALTAIAATGVPDGRRDAAHIPSLITVARVLRHAAGVTRKVTYPNGREMVYRAAACTGALYHIELYVVCGGLEGLEAGVYHFGAHDFALRRLRAGDHRATVLAASGDEPAVATAPAIVVCTSTFWRNAWKYQARAYRHTYWDCGTVLANALAIAAADDVPAKVIVGFADAMVNDLLGVDGAREAAACLVALGYDPGARPEPPPAAPPLAFETVPLSVREVDYPAIRAAHAGSSLTTPAEVRPWRAGADAWRSGPTPGDLPPPSGVTVPLHPRRELPTESIESVIARRGSTREFARTPIASDALATALAHATGGFDADFLPTPRTAVTATHLIVNAVEGLAPGAYVHHRDRAVLEQLRSGDMRREAGLLGLGQDLPADASVNVYLLANLHEILARLGSRGYRAAQLAAAITGGKLYLAAYALGLGASGLTFFDDPVIELFSPHAAGKSVMFLVAIGRGRKQKLPVGA